MPLESQDQSTGSTLQTIGQHTLVTRLALAFNAPEHKLHADAVHILGAMNGVPVEACGTIATMNATQYPARRRDEMLQVLIRKEV